MAAFKSQASLWLLVACCACSTEQITPGTALPPVPPPPPEISVGVSVLPSNVRSTVPPFGFGMHSSVYDNSLHDPAVAGLLGAAGITLLRYPGGGYSDNYHWSTHKLVPSYGGTKLGYLAAGSDFGSYVSVLESFGGTAMITVNYGSNSSATGPGEPKEAAAWVAYANGSPDDSTPIGLDTTGADWKTVGYWAGLRAASMLANDDGLNFLRIAHPAPVGIRYWEIGNEIFGNGFYTTGTGYEEDLHAPYTGSSREGDSRLSPTAYGTGVKAYVAAMKAVDASIQIGAVLDTPPLDYSWGANWDPDVLAACGQDIDFAIVHWYSSSNVDNLLNAPSNEVPRIFTELSSLFAAVGPRAKPIDVAVTETGPNFQIPSSKSQAMGLFAADGYLALLEHGVFNIDWLELHNGTFLSNSERKGPAYKGIQMAHTLASPGDALVTASADSPAIAVHAAMRADGSLGLMLVNTTPASNATVTVDLGGFNYTTASRYDYAPAAGTSDGSVVGPAPFVNAAPLADAAPPADPTALTVRVTPYAIALLLLNP